ncbi:glycosyltransferase [Spirosoma humi]
MKTRTEEIDLWADTLIVIVIYNTNLTDSVTFLSLEKSILVSNLPYSVDLLVCDNSLHSKTDITQVNKSGVFNIRYLHDLDNPGVSLSYNRASDLALVLKKKWLLVLDQDTGLPTNVVTKYQQSVNQFHGFPIYCPLVYSNSLLFSPCRYVLKKGINLNHVSPGIHSMKGRNVLNSGLLISLNAFRKAEGYDETVQLYFSDFVFFDRLKKHFKNFVVIDCNLNHSLSSVDYTNLKTALDGFIRYTKGARAASKIQNSFVLYPQYFIALFFRSVLMSLRFKNTAFFENFLKIFIG